MAVPYNSHYISGGCYRGGSNSRQTANRETEENKQKDTHKSIDQKTIKAYIIYIDKLTSE